MSNYLQPQEGPQSALLACPASEIFFGGARGGGKTHGLLLDFLQFWQDNGNHVNGAIFRRSYPELEGIIDYTLEMFPQFGAEYSYTQKKWTFPDGAWLILRHLDTKKDAARHQGKQYSYIGVDEIGAWADFAPLWMLKACLRNIYGIPSRMVLTGNPGGPGQAAIKDRYIDPAEPYELVPDENDPTWKRTYIPSRVADNKILMKNDPQYIERLKQVGADWLVKAWLDGDFNAAPDTFLGGIWDDDRHTCDPFTIPDHWKRFRSLDWGFASPYSVLWYAIDTHGKLYLYRELYGQGKGRTEGTREDAGTVAELINKAEEKEKSQGVKFMNNPADTSIWMDDGRYKAIFDIFLDNGVLWSQASKGAGSRINGAQEVIYRLVNDELVVFNTCKHFLKHVPIIPTDPKNWEDVDCWVGDTLVATPNGDKRIDSLRAGDMVCTPIGDRPVLRQYYSGLSKTIKITLTDGRVLEGTPEHKIYVDCVGLSTLSAVKCHSTLKGISTAWKQNALSIMTLFTGVTVADCTTIQVARISAMAACRYIARYGRMQMAKSLRSVSSIIRTMITTTMTYPTSSVLMTVNMPDITTTTDQIYKLSSQRGQKQVKAKEPLLVISVNAEKTRQKGGYRAAIVARLLRQGIQPKSIAQKIASAVVLGLKKAAPYVGLSSTVKAQPKLVVQNVGGLSGDKKPVYNLTVDGAHLFYANGVLSSNTDSLDHDWDSLRYGLMSRQPKSRKPKKKKIIEGSFDWVATEKKHPESNYFGNNP